MGCSHGFLTFVFGNKIESSTSAYNHQAAIGALHMKCDRQQAGPVPEVRGLVDSHDAKMARESRCLRPRDREHGQCSHAQKLINAPYPTCHLVELFGKMKHERHDITRAQVQ